MWTSGAVLSCSGGGSSFTGEEAFLGAGKDAGAGEVAWLVSGASGRAGDAGFAMFGLALELEACSGARGALKERKHQVNNQKEKYVGNNLRGRNLPRGNRSLPLGLGHANLLPLVCRLSLGLNPALPAGTSTGRGRALVQRSSVDDFLVTYNQTRSHPVPRGPFLPAPCDAAPHDAALHVSTETVN
jgi:hypothetical protein